MKKIKMFVLARCPYCRQSLNWMDELYAQNPRFKSLTIEMIDENERPDISDQYDYELVPAFYVDEQLIHSGAATKNLISDIFEDALKD